MTARSKQVKGSKERLFIMTQTHNLQIFKDTNTTAQPKKEKLFRFSSHFPSFFTV